MIRDLLQDQPDGGELEVPFELHARITESVRVRTRA
jgi:hypothetical protein